MATLTTIEFEYVIRGYHEYKRVWNPEMNERLSTEIETGNPHERYAVAVVFKEHGTVGHIPMKISRLCCSFLSRGGVVQLQVLGRRKESDLPQLLDEHCHNIYLMELNINTCQKAVTSS